MAKLFPSCSLAQRLDCKTCLSNQHTWAERLWLGQPNMLFLYQKQKHCTIWSNLSAVSHAKAQKPPEVNRANLSHDYLSIWFCARRCRRFLPSRSVSTFSVSHNTQSRRSGALPFFDSEQNANFYLKSKRDLMSRLLLLVDGIACFVFLFCAFVENFLSTSVLIFQSIPSRLELFTHVYTKRTLILSIKRLCNQKAWKFRALSKLASNSARNSLAFGPA